MVAQPDRGAGARARRSARRTAALLGELMTGVVTRSLFRRFPFSSCRTCSGIHVSAGCAGVALAARWTPEQVRGDAKKNWNENQIGVTGGPSVQIGSRPCLSGSIVPKGDVRLEVHDVRSPESPASI